MQCSPGLSRCREPEVDDPVTREPERRRDETAWRKSSRSQYNACVEVAFLDDCVPLRNSRDPDGPVLVFTAPEWDAFALARRARVLSRSSRP